jgi:hypothetical protein
MSMLEPIRLPFCDVLMTERWDAAGGRYFAAFRARHGFRWLLGHAVLEEFGTVSSPLFFAPRALLGRIYDAGISLGHRRNHEMDIDLGWPPLCVGLDRPSGDLPADWQRQLLDAITASAPPTAAEELPVQSCAVDRDALEVVRFHGADRAANVTVIATSAPLLPQQLRRLCDLDDSGLTFAIALGNRVTRQAEARPQAITALSEARIAQFAAAASELLK